MTLLQAFFCRREWSPWAWGGLVLIIASIWGQVHILVEVNTWTGNLFDLVQKALQGKGRVSQDDLYLQFLAFARLAVIYTAISSFASFLIRHWSFRWRQSITEEYLKNWSQICEVEGVSQRVQDDTMRFTKISEITGGSCVNAVITLISFMPVLSECSKQAIDVPVFGNAPNSLVYMSILWSFCVTLCFLLAGIALPRQEFLLQNNEAAYRKDLVFAEGHADLVFDDIWQLFMDCRRRYFCLAGHFLYFNLVTNLLTVFQQLVPLFCLAPTISAGKAPLGMITETTNTFQQVTGALDTLAKNWSAITELVSIVMRLHELERRLSGNKEEEEDEGETSNSETTEVV
eukprot:TRINITY_DN65090_c0_g1_i1.p1 TRINITY_DN65090_c0_g1~~TRINITY_DN65090_c0_g1_i1.p1  ORF type:complete len:345 (-),score=50.82 TRINITY_DN65090_c0_g1_i1:285-1319(-)